MHSDHHDTLSLRRQASENSLTSAQQQVFRSSPQSTQLLSQEPSHPCPTSRRNPAAFLVARVLSISIVISLTILGLAAIYTGSCVEAQAGEGNRLKIVGAEAVCD